MKTKELLDARWKVITFAALALLTSAGNAAIYPFLQPSAKMSVPSPLQALVSEPITMPFNTFAWDHWFATNGPPILGLLAAVLGGGLIANAVSKGTIFFLLQLTAAALRLPRQLAAGKATSWKHLLGKDGWFRSSSRLPGTIPTSTLIR